MKIDIASLSERLETCKVEFLYKQRERENIAASAVEALSKLTDRQVELIRERIPLILEVRNYTAEDLLKNENGEVEKVKSFYIEVTKLAKSWLKYLEDGLC